MAPRHISYRLLRRRMKRTLCYGQLNNMDQLSLPVSEAAKGYFNKNSPFDYLNLEFATNLSKEACVNPCSLIVALVYLDRMRLGDKQTFEASDPDDLYLASLLVACKYLHDDGQTEYVYNDEWAASAQRSLAHVNHIELVTLKQLDWNLLVTAAQFYQKLTQLEMCVCKREADNRGFATYNELQILSSLLAHSQFWWSQFLQPLITVLGVASLVYVASVTALVTLPLNNTLPLCTTAPANLIPDLHQHSATGSHPSICPISLSAVHIETGPNTKLLQTMDTVASGLEAPPSMDRMQANRTNLFSIIT